MKLTIEGEINAYYVQMLCMVFFPGEKFGVEEQTEDNATALHLRLQKTDEGTVALATLTADGASASAQHLCPSSLGYNAAKSAKMAAGGAVMAAGERLLGYRPAWGIMTGVRPARLASEIFETGKNEEEVRRALVNDYFATPKKAALATEVSLREKKMTADRDRRDCSMYISIPFCPSRCAYCSFVSYTSKRFLSLIPEYLTVLQQDCRNILAEIKKLNLRLRSIYIGGGTPTILEPDQLRFLLEEIGKGTDIGALEEFTLESGRPDTITAEKFHVAKELGVTRISVNPQTMSNEILRNIGRAHTAEDFLRAFEIARQSGIHCINTDLIAGLPGDHFDNFYRSFDTVLALRPENITVHTFCVKKAADYVRNRVDVYSRGGGDAGKCVDYTQIKSAQAGYVPYYMYRQKNTVGNFENVGFSLPGYEGKYNVYMMEETHSVFAAGAGAVTKAVDACTENGLEPAILRYFNHKYPYEYLREPAFEEKTKFIEDFYRVRGLID